MSLQDKVLDIYYSVKFALWDISDKIKAKFSKDEDYGSFEIEQQEVVVEEKPKKKRKSRKKKK
jgi:hypothetical protein